MAIFHLTAKIVSRGKGQNVIAAAAYRSGQELTDEQTGEIKRYDARAERIQFEGIFAPADAPDWAQNRQGLWNEVERFEKRKDAQLAREIEIALPHELTDEQRLWLVKDFTREQFTRKGYAVDVAIHAPHGGGDTRNYHAHMLVTMRTLDANGFAKMKDRSQNSHAQLQEWREDWAHLCNRHLERHGHEVRIDHRSLAAQGIDREPTIHLGYAAAQMQERGAQSDRVDRLREIFEFNEGIRFMQAEQGRDLPLADPARVAVPEHARVDSAPREGAPIYDSSSRPFDLKPETPHEREARELREKQSEARAELKAWQKFQRDDLRKELAEEIATFRTQSKRRYGAAADKAFGELAEQFKLDWKQLDADAREGKLDAPKYTRQGKDSPANAWRRAAKAQDRSPKDNALAEARAVLAETHSAALKKRRDALFDKVRDVRAASWEVARNVHKAARRAQREAHKAQWQQLASEHFNEWRDLQERRDKDFAARQQAFENAPPRLLLGGLVSTQLKAMRYLAERKARHAAQQKRDEQRPIDALNRMGDAALSRQERLGKAGRLGIAEGFAAREVTGQDAKTVTPEISKSYPLKKPEPAPVQRVQSGKAFTAAMAEFLARENAREKPSNEGNTSDRHRDKDRDGRSRSRGGDGRER
jgi:hypothetical protein